MGIWCMRIVKWSCPESGSSVFDPKAVVKWTPQMTKAQGFWLQSSETKAARNREMILGAEPVDGAEHFLSSEERKKETKQREGDRERVTKQREVQPKREARGGDVRSSG